MPAPVNPPVPAVAVPVLKQLLEHYAGGPEFEQIVGAANVQLERRRFAITYLHPLLQRWTVQGMLNQSQDALLDDGQEWLAQRLGGEDCDEDPNGAPAN